MSATTDILTDATATPVRWRRLFPWLLLFSAARIAAAPHRVLLGMALVACLLLCDRTFEEQASSQSPPLTGLPSAAGEVLPMTPDAPTGFLAGAERIIRPDDPGSVLWLPARMADQTAAVFRGGQTWSQAGTSWLRLSVTVLVCGLFGGALSRSVALRLGTTSALGLRGVVAFAGRRFGSYALAPLLPLFVAAGCWAVGSLLSLVGNVPGMGDYVVGFLWPVSLILGLLSGIMMLGTVLLWPLMFAAQSVECEDAFDGVARGFHLTLTKPWLYAWHILIVTLFGTLMLWLVRGLLALGVEMSVWATEDGLGADQLAVLQTVIGSALAAPGDEQAHAGGLALAGVWSRIFLFVQCGYAASFLWTSATVSFLLLRRSVDHIEVDEVHAGTTGGGAEIPLAGLAAHPVEDAESGLDAE